MIKKLFKYFKEEFLHVLPLFLFFLVFFTLINEIETFLLLRAGLTPLKFIEVAIASGLIAKIVLVVDHLPYIALFKKKPLLFSILWKTINYSIILLFVRLLIKLTPYYISNHHEIDKTITAFKQKTDWPFFFSVQMFYLLFLFIYVTFKELSDKIGHKKIKKLFLG